MSFAPSSTWNSGSPRACGRSPGRAVEIVGLVFTFIHAWPVAVAYLIWKVMGYPLPGNLDRFRDVRTPFRNWSGRAASFGGTGNGAFDEYRRAELDRLEAERRKLDDEAREFRSFVEDLKRAKDREEFDAYMAKRRSGTTSV